MTSRVRFLETMRLGHPDRAPLLEEGIREDVLERWRAEGLSADRTPGEIFAFDRLERMPVNLEPRPAAEERPTTEKGLKELAGRMDPSDAGRLPEDWGARVGVWSSREHALAVPVHKGFFRSMGVEGWVEFEDLIYAMADRPELVHDGMRLCGEFHAALTDRALQGITADCAILSEPIGGNFGPLLSPRMYREFVLSSYRPLLDVIRRHGIETIVFQTYADVTPLIPDLLDAGINCLWAIEVNSRAVDYLKLRKTYGPELRLIGGIDLDTLIAGKEAIRREVETKVPPLLEGGGYLPLADGRVRGTVSWENYVTYRELLGKLVGSA